MTAWLTLLFVSISPLFASSFETFTLQVNERSRRYLVHVPPAYQKGKAIPVVLNIHGGGGSAEAAEASTLMSAHADKHGYLVVYPEGTGKTFRGALHATWNAGKCCGSSVKEKVDDVAYFKAVIEDVKKQYTIDDKRIYATGLSNGGTMSYQLACSLSEKIAAIAPVGAQDVTESCELKRHVPTLHIHGVFDQCMPYQGGKGGDCFNRFLHNLLPIIPMRKETSHLTFPPVVEAVKIWAAKNGIPADVKPVEFYRNGKSECSTRKGKSAHEEVALCNVGDGGHSWPGGQHGKMCKDPSSRGCRLWLEVVGPLSREVDANEVIWSFFRKHSL